MSQEKVDRYKEQKKNRKKIMKQEKRRHFMECTAAVIVCAAIVGWLGWSIYQKYESGKPTSYTAVNLDALNQYYSETGTE